MKGKPKRIDKEAIEKIAKLDYMWRFCGIPDEYESEWERETECIKQSCRNFAQAVIEVIKGTL